MQCFSSAAKTHRSEAVARKKDAAARSFALRWRRGRHAAVSLRSLACVGLLHVVLCSAGLAQSVPKLDQILPRIQQHVKEFESSLPDFICDEKITSRELMAGRVTHETDIDSIFRGTQNKDKTPDGKYQPLPNGVTFRPLTGVLRPKASNSPARFSLAAASVQSWSKSSPRKIPAISITR